MSAGGRRNRREAGLDPGSEARRLEGLLARRPRDARLWVLLARARSALGEHEAALEALGRAGPALGAGAAGLFRAEALLDSGREAEARTVLEEARAREPGNLAVEGLLEVLGLERERFRPADLRAGIPAAALFCPPVLARLLLGLETEIEARSSAGSPPGGLHRARSCLFRPPPAPARPPPAAQGVDRETGARSERRIFADLEASFAAERFAEASRLHREWLAAGGGAAEPYPAVLAAYSLLAEGKDARALEALAPALRKRSPGGGRPPAELLHLWALAELRRGARHSAAALLRAAAEENDIALVQLAKEEAALLTA